MRTVPELVRLLACWVADNADSTSVFLTPTRNHTVDARALLTFVRDLVLGAVDLERTPDCFVMGLL